MEDKNSKVERVLGIYTKLANGCLINKEKEAAAYGVDPRSIQRDIDDIRNFLELEVGKTSQPREVVYNRMEKGYRLEQIGQYRMTNDEILAICKILLDSRAFSKKEIEELLEKIVICCTSKKNQKMISDLIGNELFHYVEPHHKGAFLNVIWDIGQAIQENLYIEIDYFRTKDRLVVKRKVKPVAILFSEYYFYLTAFIDDENIRKDFDVINDSFPTIYRMDRINKLTVLKEHFHIPYRDRFEEGEFRKRIQFMYGGKLRRVKFIYKGPDIEAVLDRLPTARIMDETERGYIVSAEVFGDGIDMWLRSQGDFIEEIRG